MQTLLLLANAMLCIVVGVVIMKSQTWLGLLDSGWGVFLSGSAIFVAVVLYYALADLIVDKTKPKRSY